MVFTAAGSPNATRTGRPGLTAVAGRRANEVIAESAQRRPDAVALRMVADGGMDVWTYRRLWDRVRRIRDGAFADLPYGSRVVMAQAGDAVYVAEFLAAMEAGLVPVPLYLPSADAPGRFLQRARHVLRDCEPSAVYTSPGIADALG